MPRARKPKVGRPPLPAGLAASERVELRLTPAQREQWTQAAERQGVTLKAWLVEAAELAIARGATR